MTIQSWESLTGPNITLDFSSTFTRNLATEGSTVNLLSKPPISPSWPILVARQTGQVDAERIATERSVYLRRRR